ncbi:hypothetical protein ZWY2020_045209 [Hordeum vulgare]|nr:hypothetical protein ZWY2020_045209 [Hordeum vulgare]
MAQRTRGLLRSTGSPTAPRALSTSAAAAEGEAAVAAKGKNLGAVNSLQAPFSPLSLRVDDRHITGYIMKGNLHLSLNRPDLAVTDFRGAQELRADLRSYQGLVRAYLALSKCKDALFTAREAMKIALRREKIGATARFWGFSAASYPDLVEASRKNPLTSVNKTVNGSFDQPSSAGGDVYPVEPYESLSMNQVLDAHWGVLDDEDKHKLRKYCTVIV